MALQGLIDRMRDEFNEGAARGSREGAPPKVTYQDISDALALPGPSGPRVGGESQDTSPAKEHRLESVAEEGARADSPPPLGKLSDSEDEEPVEVKRTAPKREWKMTWSQCPNIIEYLGDFHRSLLAMRRAQDAEKAFLAAPPRMQKKILRMQTKLVKQNTEALIFLKNLEEQGKK